MKMEECVCILESAKELKELGIEQKSNFYWNKNVAGKKWKVFHTKYLQYFHKDNEERYSAFLSSELTKYLPSSIKMNNNEYYLFMTKTTKTEHFKLPDNYIGYKNFDNEYACAQRDGIEAEAKAKMLIYLIKRRIINLRKNKEK